MNYVNHTSVIILTIRTPKMKTMKTTQGVHDLCQALPLWPSPSPHARMELYYTQALKERGRERKVGFSQTMAPKVEEYPSPGIARP